MKAKISVLLLAVLASITSVAQTYDFKGVKNVSTNNINPIIENSEIKGYYVFYFLEKVNKKDNLYSLEILDNNLKPAYSVEMVKSKRLSLLESSYNGERFCFSFLDAKENLLEYTFLDKTGKSVGSYTSEISASETNIYAAALQNEDDSYNGSLFACKGKGFVRIGFEKEGGTRIHIEMLDNNGKRKWDAKSGVTSKKSYEVFYAYHSDENVFIGSLSTREGLLSKNVKTTVICYDVETGKENFRLPTENKKYQLATYGASLNKGLNTYFIYGQYYKPDDNIAKDDPIGFFILEVNANGSILSESYTEWEGSIYTALVRKSGGKIEKNMKTFIHRITKTEDGKIFAIGEQYRKAVSGGGVALSVLSGGRSGVAMAKIEIHDMVVLEFDNAMKFKDLTIFDKEKTNVTLPQGWGLLDANLLGYMMKMYNKFDYKYMTVSSDRKIFNCAYLDYDSEKGSNLTVGNISYTKDHKLAIDKVKLSSKPYSVGIVEAKPGYVAIFEYYRKDKRALLRLEKLNL